ncbi:MAG: hypothetical protein ABIJ61_08465, partial [bacterium]
GGNPANRRRQKVLSSYAVNCRSVDPALPERERAELFGEYYGDSPEAKVVQNVQTADSFGQSQVVTGQIFKCSSRFPLSRLWTFDAIISTTLVFFLLD